MITLEAAGDPKGLRQFAVNYYDFSKLTGNSADPVAELRLF